MKRSLLRMFLGIMLILGLLLFTACEDKSSSPSGVNAMPTINITGPTNYWSYSTTQNTVTISGVATDDDLNDVKIFVNNGPAQLATGLANWEKTGVVLNNGNNEIICQATDKSGNVAKDTLYVTLNPDIEFINATQVSHNSIFVSTSTDVTVRQLLVNSTNVNPANIRLLRLNADFTVNAELDYLVDNGDLYEGDEISNDAFYSVKANIYETTEGIHYYRVVAYSNDNQQANYSPIFSLNVFPQVTYTQLQEVVQVNEGAVAHINNANITTIAQAKVAIKSWAESQPGVSSVQMIDGAIQVTYNSGVKGFINFIQTSDSGEPSLGAVQRSLERRHSKTPLSKQIRGVNSMGSNKYYSRSLTENDEDKILDKDVLIWSPIDTFLGAYSIRAGMQNILNNSDIGLNATVLTDAQCTVASLANLTDYGVVAVNTHGLGGDFIMTGEIMTLDNIYEHLLQLINGELTYFENISYTGNDGFVTQGTFYTITSKFINNLSGTFPQSVIFNASCEGTKTMKLYNAFTNKGAKTYLGFSKVVGSAFARDMCSQFFQKLMVQIKTTGESFTSGQSDPNFEHAVFEMLGSDDMYFPMDLINGDFEMGNMTGWTRYGDGRVITQLGFLDADEGFYMGIISTGLGYTEASGSIAQSFRVGPNESTLSLRWNFLSEEFMEWVGSVYQDTYSIKIVDSLNVYHTIVSENIDSFAANYSLSAVSPDIVFDHDGVYMTGWQTSTFDLTPYRGQIIRLVITVGDVGDSAYDSAALLDDIKVE